MVHTEELDNAPLEALRRVPFVKKLRYTPLRGDRDLGYDARIDVRTREGRFEFVVAWKRSYLTRSEVSQFLAWRNHLRDRPQRVMLFARHVPRPAAESLIEASVNFADDAGNIHLTLGDRYNWTVIGVPAPEPASKRRPISPASLQLLFQFVTHPESVNWPVRRLESPAGISKSKAAQSRREMIAEGLLLAAGKQYKLSSTNLLGDRLVSGYTQVLRPKLVLGTFRPPEKTADSFLTRLRTRPQSGVRYSLSGIPAAYLLQHYYRGPEVALFVEPATRTIAQQFRLLPDREGPVTVLRAFGDLVFWEQRGNQTIAPPWLIYAELLSTKDPRAHEAAGEFRREILEANVHP